MLIDLPMLATSPPPRTSTVTKSPMRMVSTKIEPIADRDVAAGEPFVAGDQAREVELLLQPEGSDRQEQAPSGTVMLAPSTASVDP